MTGAAGEDGPLPALFVLLAFTTGMVDATSFLDLGSVFVAAMTGNIIILGLGIAGFGTPLSAALSLLSFAAGAICAGRAARSRLRPLHRGRRLAAGTAVQAALVCGAVVVGTRYGFADELPRRAVIMMLAFSLGWEYAIVRALRVRDLNTTVVTTTLTSLFAESVAPVRQSRRLVSICALLAGAFASGALRRAVHPTAPLWAAVLVLAACAVTAFVAAGRPGAERWR
ncbi:uncharacterized membrane protein YoaK (UPF0700 family) [Actinocorallia herbida]|uniref:Uncharacterized membrane protein YoaK (UPF0700 family) n=1 Tax=Actinocorallia herbida TaxID=58109 RepID=A0A3N1CW61_9ACTN|nr:YoaK family protein [Actinocorallia herbida]ROO85530.1 uncharacterized membrane protein YoaK (UPF0700 family) [Actinocorallia herbida]